MKTAVRVVLALLLGAPWSGCAEPNNQGGDSQTNWLRACTSDAECDGELACVCNVCTRVCSADAECAGLDGASCAPASSTAALAQCGDAPASAMCLPACDTANPCADGFVCSAGSCVREGPSLPPLSGDLLEFCSRFYAALCDHLEACQCDAETVANCRATDHCSDNAFLAPLVDPVATGALLYDAAAADALIARLSVLDAPCEGVNVDLGFDSFDVHSLGGVFIGTREAGEACSIAAQLKRGGVSDCAEGSLCMAQSDGSNACVAFAALDEACDPDPDPARVCLLRRPADSDGEFESSTSSLRCVADSSGSGAGVCRSDLATGEACNHSEQCESGRCDVAGVDDGLCADKLPNGQACEFSSDCASERCGSDLACADPLADGQTCLSDADCEGAFCGASGNCEAAPAPLSLGATCTEHRECETGRCFRETCRPRICGDFLPEEPTTTNFFVEALSETECLPRQLSVETDTDSSDFGAVACSFVEATPADGSACEACEGRGRSTPDANLSAASLAYLESTSLCGGEFPACDESYCLCEFAQLAGDDLQACQNDANEPAGVDGFCYVDPAQGAGNAEIVAACDATAQRSLRFVGAAAPAADAVVLAACAGAT
ncbi:MAG TPA: hypothetical protein VF989_19085 [Polyangiaceae bacterium]